MKSDTLVIVSPSEKVKEEEKKCPKKSDKSFCSNCGVCL